MRGSRIPSPDLKEVRDLVRYRVKTAQARAPQIQRLQKTLETAGINLDPVVRDSTGMSATAMTEALTGGERRGGVPADLALGRMRAAGKLTGLPMALAGRLTDHHALMRRLHLDRITMFGDAAGGLDATISPLAARHTAEAGLLGTIPGFGDVVTAGWLGATGPAPHQHFGTAERLASWVTSCPGNYISARTSRSGRTGDDGNHIKPLLAQAACAAIRVPGRLQARFHRLARKPGGPKNKGAQDGRSSRSRAPCSRSPAPYSKPASPATSPAPATTPTATPPRPGTTTRCASRKAQPRLRRHHHPRGSRLTASAG